MRSQPGIVAAALVACASLAADVAVKAAASENPYHVIVRHNPFDLRPIVPPEPAKPPPPPPEEPPAKVHLTGIVTLSGPKAFLQVEDPKTKKTEFLPPLAIGERYKEITVLGIDAKTHTVRIRHGGIEDTLDFLNDGLKPVAAAPKPPAPTRTQAVPRPTPPTPTRHRGTVNSFSATPVPTSGRGAIVAGGGMPSPAPTPTPSPSPRAPRTMSRAEVEARIALEREIRMRNNDPTYRLLPPITR